MCLFVDVFLYLSVQLSYLFDRCSYDYVFIYPVWSIYWFVRRTGSILKLPTCWIYLCNPLDMRVAQFPTVHPDLNWKDAATEFAFLSFLVGHKKIEYEPFHSCVIMRVFVCVCVCSFSPSYMATCVGTCAYTIIYVTFQKVLHEQKKNPGRHFEDPGIHFEVEELNLAQQKLVNCRRWLWKADFWQIAPASRSGELKALPLATWRVSVRWLSHQKVVGSLGSHRLHYHRLT